MRSLLDIFAQTLRTLWAHKLRSFLTMFGIAWGVGSLLMLVGLGEGWRSGNQKQLNEIGESIMFIFPGRVPPVAGSHMGMKPYWLTYRDVEDIRREASHVDRVSPVIQRQDVKVVSQYQSAGGQIFGIQPVYNQIRYLPIGGGRWLNELDEQQKRHVAFVGWEMRKNLFPGRPVLGETILLNGVRFDVIGFMDQVGRDENNGTNVRVFIPYSAMAELFPMKQNDIPIDSVSFINFHPVTKDDHLLASQEVRHIIARNHGFDEKNEDAFEDWDTIQSAQTVGKIFDAMNSFLGSVGLVTLALGAVGVVNIMLVSVTERTKEIGLRKALGATNRNIMSQFFIEGAFLTLLSGGIGIGLAGGFMGLLGMLPAPQGFDLPHLVPWSIALAVGTLSVAGTIAGMYPARQAALLTPVEALRKD